MSAMECKECGATFTPYKADQLFCCGSHASKHRQKAYRQRAQIKHAEALQATTEIDDLKQQNSALQIEIDRLKEENEMWKESIKKHNERIGRLEEIIDKRDDTITSQKKEIERLKLERRVIDQQKRTKRTSDLTRSHLNAVLNKELRRQFPNSPETQAHIGAIRSFNAHYINAVVAQQ